MSFIGVVANRRCFDNLKKKIVEELKDENINFIQINLRSIENVKNIKFETIIIEDNLEKFKNNKQILNQILSNTEYIIINTDKNKEENKENENKITYGLNQNAIVTVSSISDIDTLIYWQKPIKNKNGDLIEIEEKRVKKIVKSTLRLYEILIVYTFLKIYNKKIIDEMQEKSNFFE